MMEAMMKGIKNTFVKAFDIGFQVAYTRIKNAFLRIQEMVLMDTTHQKTLSTMLIKNFDQLSQSNVLMNSFIEKIHTHPMCL